MGIEINPGGRKPVVSPQSAVGSCQTATAITVDRELERLWRALLSRLRINAVWFLLQKSRCLPIIAMLVLSTNQRCQNA